MVVAKQTDPPILLTSSNSRNELNRSDGCWSTGFYLVLGAPLQSKPGPQSQHRRLPTTRPRPHSTTHPTPSERPDRHISQNLANSSPFHGPKGAWWGLVESKYIENVSRYQKVRRRGRPKPKIGKNEVFSGYLARYSFHPPDMPVQSFR